KDGWRCGDPPKAASIGASMVASGGIATLRRATPAPGRIRATPETFPRAAHLATDPCAATRHPSCASFVEGLDCVPPSLPAPAAAHLCSKAQCAVAQLRWRNLR